VLFELVLLTALASAIAMLFLAVGLNAFRDSAAGILPRAGDITLDPGVFGFAVLLGLTCPLLVAVPFALRLRRRMSGNLRAGDKGTGTTATGALRLLPVAGLALATAALIAGSAVALSLDRLKNVDPGFAARELFAVQAYHQGGPDEWRRFAREVAARIAAEPDVAGVAVTTIAPLAPGGRYWIDAQLPGHDRPEAWQTVLERVSPGYLDVIGQALLFGRGFLPTDSASAAKVAIVNETFARRAFGTTDVVGQRIGLALRDGAREDFAIVGVSADIRNATIREAADPEILVPSVQVPWIGMTFLARAPRAGADLLDRMQNAVWAVDPREAITRAAATADDLDAQLAQTVFFTRMLGGFAVLAVLLAAFGTYSVVAFLQRRRIRETGIRLALGAEPLTVARRVLLQGIVLAACAGIAGSLAAVAVLRLLASELFGVDAGSPALYALGVGGALLAATAASVAPAWRAARVAPMEALRHE
jgi:putative ABC transport system permease protein